MCRNHKFDCLVNNAGILSPPRYKQTDDGLEYTFQVNFLSHLLINELILRSDSKKQPFLIVSVTSPAYRIADPDLGPGLDSSKYNPIKAYSSSKLYIALMGEYLTLKHNDLEIKNFSFDPGTFRSHIYRMQKKWFRTMYRIGGPLLKDPAMVAGALVRHLENNEIISGLVYSKSGVPKKLPGVSMRKLDKFMQQCFGYLEKLLT